MAYVYKRGKTWAVRFSKRTKVWDAEKQKEVSKLKQKQKGGFKTKLEARQYGIEMESTSLTGVDVTKNPIFADYCKQWFETYKFPSARESTKLTYIKHFHDIQKYFGTTKIKDIDRTQYQKFINWYGKNHAPASVRKLNIMVKACVFAAIDDGIINRSFTNQVNIHGNDAHTRDVEYLNLTEIKRLVDTIVDNRQIRYPSNYMILTAIYTGARLGELSALHWGDINFDNQIISITKSWNQQRHEMNEPKTKNSIRDIKVNKWLLDIISELKENHEDFVFATPRTNFPPSSQAINQALRRQLDKAGITKQGYHFHSLRHSHVAYLLSQGIDVSSISQRLGHADITTTMKIYAYLLDEYKDKQDNKIVASLSKLN